MSSSGSSVAYLAVLATAIILSRYLGRELGKRAGGIGFLIFFVLAGVVASGIACFVVGGISETLAHMSLINSMMASTGISQKVLELQNPNNSLAPAVFGSIWGIIIAATYGSWRMIKSFKASRNVASG